LYARVLGESYMRVHILLAQRYPCIVDACWARYEEASMLAWAAIEETAYGSHMDGTV